MINENWNNEPASKKQTDYMLRHNIVFEPNCTKGQATILISRYIKERDNDKQWQRR